MNYIPHQQLDSQIRSGDHLPPPVPANPASSAHSVLTAARQIYTSYCETRSEPQQPVGVAVDRDTHRGQLIFAGKPILLPHECFVPFSQIETAEPA